jgi:hypothetical protein
MAIITLEHGECEEGFLPPICIRCGNSAMGIQNRMFQWIQPILYITVFLCFPLFIALYFLFRKRVMVAVPVCDRHRNMWMSMQFFSVLGPIVMFAGVILGILYDNDLTRRGEKEDGMLILTGAGIILGTALIMFGSLLIVRPVRITRDAITLRGVSPIFVEMVDQYRILLDDDDD